MANLNALLNQRVKKADHSSKMTEMARQSANGNRSSFTGIFGCAELSPVEKASLEAILQEYSLGDENIRSDLEQLMNITSEVKAINNQAAILHGERIKKAHTILIRYRDGAFTAWLMATYGNRQTPYNLMQYYEFYEATPKELRPQLESMPRQAIYTLASRQGDINAKLHIVANYNGETKLELLSLIRCAFPLNSDDRRRANFAENAISILSKLHHHFDHNTEPVSQEQKQTIIQLLKQLQSLIS